MNFLSRLFPFLMAGLITVVGCVFIVAIGDQRDQARLERNLAQSELAAQRKAARLAGEQLAARDAIDKQRTEELNRALDENQSLRSAVDDGRKRLLVKATCRAPVPGTTSAAGLADAGTAELAADARSDYFTLRDQLALAREMILGLQDYIRQVVQRTPAHP